MAQFPLDEPFTFEGKAATTTGIDGIVNNFKDHFKSEKMTPRDLGALLSLGGTVPIPIGTPEMVADVFEQWMDGTGINGFNVCCS